MIIPVSLGNNSYNIYLERGAIQKAGELLNLDRRVLLVTDSGVPKEYVECIEAQCKEPSLCVIAEGEASKSLENWTKLLGVMTEKGFTRSDCVVAVGGGVVGDLSGFVAAAYMRGIDFYNIPTTVLSQVDSSIGGKVAIDFAGYKNIVGAFHQPKAVIVDPDTLKTLPKRHIVNGLIEALKMSMTFDGEMFSLFENCNIEDNIQRIIEGSLKIKKTVVEQDEKEAGLRKVLNFGHTIGHAIESNCNFGEIYHGECVGLGMLAMCKGEVRQRLFNILKKLNAPVNIDWEAEKLILAMKHDKKMSGDKISIVYVEKIGDYKLETIGFSELEKRVKEVTGV